MKIYLAAFESRPPNFIKESNCKYVMQSFYYVKDYIMNYYYSDKCKKFMLDSGAFTFMENKDKKVNWIKYLDKYIDFINKHDIDLFFELDIDNVVGLEKVRKLRKQLEKKTGKKSIPVWHKSRGKDCFISLCKKYDYVAIGGIVANEINRKNYKYFSWFIKKAHKNNTKIHGLGFTNIKLLPKYNFDSVDSTSWLSGGRFAHLYKFKGRFLKQINKPNNKKSKGYKILDKHNLSEWVKYQKYAERNL